MKMRKKKFFSKQTAHSRAKAEIIAKYFPAWARVVGSRTTKIVYTDLYAGRGRYDDGKESTPLLVLQRAIDDPLVSEMLVTIFNDKNPANADALRAEIAALPGIDKLKHRPVVYAAEVAEDTAKLFEDVDLAPTLALLDPWGYKGLTRRLIQSLLKDWGCDLVFFFNYNRINLAVRNKNVARHMEALFGPEWLAQLRQELPGLSPKERERVILRALRNGLRDVGARYVRHFRFLKPTGRTSHYLIFVSKKFKGVEIMRDVMANASSRHDNDGVASFTYDPRPVQLDFTRPEPKRLERLQNRIKRDLAGNKLTVRALFERHSEDSPFTLRNYQEALRRLEAAREVAIVRPTKRSVYAGKAVGSGNSDPSLSGNSGRRLKAPRSRSSRGRRSRNAASGRGRSDRSHDTA